MTAKPIAVVTGGAGFIGSHMVDLLLLRDFEVRVVDNLSGGHQRNLEHHAGNPGLKCFWNDIRALEPASDIFSGAKYVFHFAGIDRKSTRLNSSHVALSRMPSSA